MTGEHTSPFAVGSYVEFTLDVTTQSLLHSYLLENNGNTWASAKPYPNTDSALSRTELAGKMGRKDPCPVPSLLGHSILPLLPHLPSEDFVFFRIKNYGLSTEEWCLSQLCWWWFTLSKILNLYEPATVPAIHHSAEEWRASTPPFHYYGGLCLFSHVKPQ